MSQSPKTIRVEIPADVPVIYANFAVINHSPSEIVIDLAQLLPNVPQARVQARVVLTPLNAKALYQALGENLAKYEARFGEIKQPPGPEGPGGLIWRVAPE
ncbi:MAG: DUF3467 domain-containing protein [Chloroflexi bacterium]|nr:DUF3467 domain-containing protein [Chloroflexota bacterium]